MALKPRSFHCIPQEIPTYIVIISLPVQFANHSFSPPPPLSTCMNPSTHLQLKNLLFVSWHENIFCSFYYPHHRFLVSFMQNYSKIVYQLHTRLSCLKSQRTLDIFLTMSAFNLFLEQPSKNKCLNVAIISLLQTKLAPLDKGYILNSCIIFIANYTSSRSNIYNHSLSFVETILFSRNIHRIFRIFRDLQPIDVVASLFFWTQ